MSIEPFFRSSERVWEFGTTCRITVVKYGFGPQ